MPQPNPFPNPLTGKYEQPAGPTRQGEQVFRPGSPLNTSREPLEYRGINSGPTWWGDPSEGKPVDTAFSPDIGRQNRRDDYFIDRPDPLANPQSLEDQRRQEEIKRQKALNDKLAAEGRGSAGESDYFSPGNPNPDIDLFSSRQKRDYDALMLESRKNERRRKGSYLGNQGEIVHPTARYSGGSFAGSGGFDWGAKNPWDDEAAQPARPFITRDSPLR